MHNKAKARPSAGLFDFFWNKIISGVKRGVVEIKLGTNP
jgi:hypothetical protein